MKCINFHECNGLTRINYRFKKHIDTLFFITHTSTFNISLQALMLLLQIVISLSGSAAGSPFTISLTDRFYRTLYSSLIDSRLSTSNKQAMYLNLIFKALKFDSNIDRVKAFVRRFIQMLAIGIGAGGGGTEFVAGGLYLLGEVGEFVLNCSIIFNIVMSSASYAIFRHP